MAIQGRLWDYSIRIAQTDDEIKKNYILEIA